ncbi:hypothetical protein GW17_00056405, partial [Ensete ventricosum]
SEDRCSALNRLSVIPRFHKTLNLETLSQLKRAFFFVSLFWGTSSTDPSPNQHQGGASMPSQNFTAAAGAAAGGVGQAASASASASASAGGGTGPPRQKVRARRGQATDPHSIAERVSNSKQERKWFSLPPNPAKRLLLCLHFVCSLVPSHYSLCFCSQLRRERIADRMKALQELVPNANKRGVLTRHNRPQTNTMGCCSFSFASYFDGGFGLQTDKASMLDEIIDYVKFLQLQVKAKLSFSGFYCSLLDDDDDVDGISDTNSSGDSLTVTEHQVAKLMEEDMGSAMQYLQGKGLCLMPISLASAISTATACPPRLPSSSSLSSAGAGHLGHGILPGGLHPPNLTGDAPASPGVSALTAQSAMANGGAEAAKEAVTVSKA